MELFKVRKRKWTETMTTMNQTSYSETAIVRIQMEKTCRITSRQQMKELLRKQRFSRSGMTAKSTPLPGVAAGRDLPDVILEKRKVSQITSALASRGQALSSLAELAEVAGKAAL